MFNTTGRLYQSIVEDVKTAFIDSYRIDDAIDIKESINLILERE